MADFRNGARDVGRANPPPWHHIVMVLMGIIVSLLAGYFGISYECIGDVYVRGPCALLCVFSFMFSFTFVAEAYDQARERGEDIY